MRSVKWWVSGVAALLATGLVHADVKLPEIFCDGMVLQRDMKLPIWGTAQAGEKVLVVINGQSKETVADNAGNWKIELAPMQAGGPMSLEVTGNNSIRISDVMVGEVWVCSGQSNMEWIVRNVNNSQQEIDSANYPNIRLFNVPRVWSQRPMASIKAKWVLCSPQTVANFSAVGYFFGREIYRTLNVPVGLISSSWGGTRIEPWTPTVGFQAVPELKGYVDMLRLKDPTSDAHKKLVKETVTKMRQWADKTEQGMKTSTVPAVPPEYPKQLLPFANQQEPTALYNGMIYGMVPYAIRGAIWYQGEANLGDGKSYTAKMRALVNGWRKVFDNPEMPFYFVQLAPFNYGPGGTYQLPLIWEAQAEFARTTPHAGMVVVNDIGNVKDIHPRNKQEVGHRLAQMALSRTYAQPDITCDSPSFKDYKVNGNRLVVSFSHAKELRTRDGKIPSCFEIAGKDGVFYPAEAQIGGTDVCLSSFKVNEPYLVRFAWNMMAEPNLVNEAGLPACPFRAGELPECGLLESKIPESNTYKLVYSMDPVNPVLNNNGAGITYRTNKAGEISGKIKRIGYFMSLTRIDGNTSYVWVSMDAFTQDIKKIGVPTKDSGAQFQSRVKNMSVKSNVNGVDNGNFTEGNIEFWGCNYGPQNAAGVPGADNNANDFGDKIDQPDKVGYGSMQVHNFGRKGTVFAFNNWRAGHVCDVGIGNNPVKPHSDWTFSASANTYVSGQLLILVELE